MDKKVRASVIYTSHKVLHLNHTTADSWMNELKKKLKQMLKENALNLMNKYQYN